MTFTKNILKYCKIEKMQYIFGWYQLNSVYIPKYANKIAQMYGVNQILKQ